MTQRSQASRRITSAGCALALACGVIAASALPASSTHHLPLEYEAEDATLFGGAGVNDNHLGYSGTGFVDGFVIDHQGTAGVTFEVEVPEDGEYGLNLRYANGHGSDMTMSQVIGEEDRQITLPSAPGAGWSQWFIHQEVVTLEEGLQEITYRFDADDTGNVNIDAIALAEVGDLDTPGGGATDPGSIPGVGPDLRWDTVSNSLDAVSTPGGGHAYPAQDAFYANGAAATGADAVDMTAERARLIFTTFATDAGQQSLTLRYRNSAEADVDVVVGIDGDPQGQLTLPPTASLTDVTVSLPVREGLGTVEIRRVGDEISTGELAVSGLRLERATDPAERGATLGTTIYEAEHGITNGEILEPSRSFRDMAAEASGRQAVTLHDAGDEVGWTLTSAASGLVARVSIPDTADGAGQSGSLAVFAGSTQIATLPVSSEFAWVYGDYPYGNDPSQGGAQRFFDDSRVAFAEVPAGTTLRLVKDGASADLPYTVDLIETEQVAAPLTMPDGFIDVRDHGATANDGTDDRAAIMAAVEAAKDAGTGVWIPEGRFTVTEVVRLDGVTLRGAGPWHSVIEGRDNKGGLYAMGTGVTIADLMIDGDVRYRNDSLFDSGIEGNFGQGSLIQNVWINHTKTGLWVGAGTDGLLAVGLRVHGTFADGVHLHGGVTDSTVAHVSVRNTGDDALAMWSSGGSVTRGVFTNATVQSPLLGNGAVIYGGDSNSIVNSVVADTLTAPAGIAVSTRFNPIPFSGTTVVEGNDIFRSGGWEPNWTTSFGGIWVFADTSHITTPVIISDTRIIDSTYEGILVSGGHWVNDLRVSDVLIETTGAYAVAARVGGDHRFQNVVVSGVDEPEDNRNHLWGNFIDDGGNVGLHEETHAPCMVAVAGGTNGDGTYDSTLTVMNTGADPLSVSSVVWHAGSGEAVLGATGATVSQNGTRVEAVIGGAPLEQGAALGFTVSGTLNSAALAAVDRVLVNGLACDTVLAPAALATGADAVVAGGDVTVTAQGFLPGESVSFSLQPGGATLGSAEDDADGQLSLSLTVPGTITPGQYTLLAVGGTSGVTAGTALEVLAASGTDPDDETPGGSTPSPEQPQPGSPSVPDAGEGASDELSDSGVADHLVLLALVSLLLLLAGVGLAMRRRTIAP